MILFKVLVDHILLLIFGNTVAKVDGSIELRLIFLKFYFRLIKCGVFALVGALSLIYSLK
jgi:hypothetical protein